MEWTNPPGIFTGNVFSDKEWRSQVIKSSAKITGDTLSATTSSLLILPVFTIFPGTVSFSVISVTDSMGFWMISLCIQGSCLFSQFATSDSVVFSVIFTSSLLSALPLFSEDRIPDKASAYWRSSSGLTKVSGGTTGSVDCTRLWLPVSELKDSEV